MKGTIAVCLQRMVIENFGEQKWQEAMVKAGFEKSKTFNVIEDVPDEGVLKVVGCVCQVLNISLPQAADAFGDYWINTYAPKLYKSFFALAKDAKQFLLSMDMVHQGMTKGMKNAQPPRFEYEWKNDNTLIMKYLSHRKLIDFMVGLARGVGKYYKEKLEVKKLDDGQIEIIFPKNTAS
jgi:hypothetical protein